MSGHASRIAVHPARSALVGSVPIFADAAIATHALVVAAIADGRSRIVGRDLGPRLAGLAEALRRLGAGIETTDDGFDVTGRATKGLACPDEPVTAPDCLSFHLLAGLLAGQGFAVELIGPPIEPGLTAELRAALTARGVTTRLTCAPQRTVLAFEARATDERLKPVEWRLDADRSALKGALLLSGLYASGPSTIAERIVSADHCERLLDALSLPIEVHGSVLGVHPPRDPDAVKAFSVDVPGDVDAAALLALAAATIPDSRVEVRGVGLNPTRAGVIEVLRLFGADLRVEPHGTSAGEPFGRIQCASARLRGVALGGEPLERLSRVGPAVVAAARARSESSFEAGRCASRALELARRLGLAATVEPDGAVRVSPGAGSPLSEVRADGDAETAVCALILGLSTDAPTTVLDADCLSVFPRFAATLRALGAQVVMT